MPDIAELKRDFSYIIAVAAEAPEEEQDSVLELWLAKHFPDFSDAADRNLEIKKIKYDSLLREIHNIDHITEIHSSTVITISSGLIAFAAYNSHSIPVVIATSVLGICVATLWFLKTLRHRDIFRYCYDQLSALEFNGVRISAFRPLEKKRGAVFSFDGFTLLLWFSALLIVSWLGLIFAIVVMGLSLKAS